MPFRLPEDIDESKLPPFRWRRGPVVDVDSEHRKKLHALGAEEISREDATEVVVEAVHSRGAKREEAQQATSGESPKAQGKPKAKE